MILGAHIILRRLVVIFNLCAPLLRCFFYVYSFVRPSELAAANPHPLVQIGKTHTVVFAVLRSMSLDISA